MSNATPVKNVAVIIGAGPAGLTAAYELQTTTDIRPIVLEMSEAMGGISRTVTFGGNKMDLGGHRFFSKSDRVIAWWLDKLPVHADASKYIDISYQQKEHTLKVDTAPSNNTEDVMLVRQRISRIYFDNKFFSYPLTLSWDTIKALGFMRMMRIGITYLARLVTPRKEENLEDFFINRFGTELYSIFFKTYTEKVWGLPCTQIGADWGRQRIKGLSVRKAIVHGLKQLMPFKKQGVGQKNIETSLIEYFLYPKYGPGHLWEKVAQMVRDQGGEVITRARVINIEVVDSKVTSVTYEDTTSKERHTIACSYVFSSMPINDLFNAFTQSVPEEIKSIATRLQFREFITVGLLLESEALRKVKDTWIYVHDPSVKVGRIQFFHNWSPHLVTDPTHTLIGMEYFCTEGDAFWNLSDEELQELAKEELTRIGLPYTQVLQTHVERVYKAYPVYTGAYTSFERIQEYINGIENLYPIGRNGMHRYNNQDHSMLTAMASVEATQGKYVKEAIWEINADEDYHEEK